MQTRTYHTANGEHSGVYHNSEDHPYGQQTIRRRRHCLWACAR